MNFLTRLFKQISKGFYKKIAMICVVYFISFAPIFLLSGIIVATKLCNPAHMEIFFRFAYFPHLLLAYYWEPYWQYLSFCLITLDIDRLRAKLFGVEEPPEPEQSYSIYKRDFVDWYKFWYMKWSS